MERHSGLTIKRGVPRTVCDECRDHNAQTKPVRTCLKTFYNPIIIQCTIHVINEEGVNSD